MRAVVVCKESNHLCPCECIANWSMLVVDFPCQVKRNDRNGGWYTNQSVPSEMFTIPVNPQFPHHLLCYKAFICNVCAVVPRYHNHAPSKPSTLFNIRCSSIDFPSISAAIQYLLEHVARCVSGYSDSARRCQTSQGLQLKV